VETGIYSLSSAFTEILFLDREKRNEYHQEPTMKTCRLTVRSHTLGGNPFAKLNAIGGH